MILERQKLVMALLAANGGTLDRVDFQKLLFLFTQQCEQNPSYEFVPFKKGCFSFTAMADKRGLVEKGLLADSEDWQLTEAGKEKADVIPKDLRWKLTLFSDRRKQLRGDSLVASVYRAYPYWATHSRIAPSVLAGDDAALAAIEKARPVRAVSVLCSIGYEGRSLEGYLNALLKAGVSVLCDVRKNAFSRKFGFSKAMLASVCPDLGIRYEHVPELGIESGERQELNELADYQRLFLKYERTVLPMQTDALERIAAWVKSGECVALTCFERLPEYCHRTRVAHAVEKLIGNKAIDL
jgi:hypothetical protein